MSEATEVQKKYALDIGEALGVALPNYLFLSKARTSEFISENADAYYRLLIIQSLGHYPDNLPPEVEKQVETLLEEERRSRFPKSKTQLLSETINRSISPGFLEVDPQTLTTTSLKSLGYWFEVIKSTAFDNFGSQKDLFQRKAGFSREELKAKLAKCTTMEKSSQPDGVEVSQEPVRRHIVLKLQNIDTEKNYDPIVLGVFEIVAVPDASQDSGYKWKIENNQAPQFNRQHLGTSANNDMLLLSNVEAFDKWCSEILENDETYISLDVAFSRMDESFALLASEDDIDTAEGWWSSTQQSNAEKYYNLKYLTLKYNLVDGGLLKGGTRNLCGNLLQLCKSAEDLGQTPSSALLRQLIDPHTPSIAPPTFSFSDYRGMIYDGNASDDIKFPLEKTQRQATRIQRLCRDGQLVAVNGPPGTGKTSMLRAIIASEWISAITSADQEINPPLIVATSATNQAVTNIISGFSDVPSEPLFDNEAFLDFVSNNDDEGACNNHYFFRDDAKVTLTSRWLPLLSSYGYFCPSTLGGDKAKQYEHFQLLVKDKANIETGGSIRTLDKAIDTHLNTLIDVFIACAREYVGEQIDKSMEYTLESVAQFFKSHFDTAKSKGIENIFFVCDVIFDQVLNKEMFNSDEYAAALTNAITRSILSNPLYATNLPDKALSNLRASLETVPFTSDRYKALAQYRTIIDDFLDKYIRAIDFHVAARFYEAYFLLKLKEFATYDSKKEDGQLPDHELMRLWGLLSPVYVVTAHSLPKLLRCHKGREEGSPAFMYGEVDLLIFDEAGQCSPEIGGGAFAFAKRAIVVGDVEQLEPVWSIIDAQDKLNLKKFKLDHQEREAFLSSGKACSSGSIMKMAQRASMRAFPEQLDGPTLNAHFRCAPQIIEICKTLAYPELSVKTKFKSLWKDDMARSLGYLVVEDVEDTAGASGSRSNVKEARIISKWIEENCKDIEAFYKKKIWDVVAVVTPFTGQRQVLQQEIGQILSHRTDLPGDRVGDFFTINTVHSLQGAEKEIVIFSMVETSNPDQKQFFDNGVNLINVAVSRAKSLFIVALTQQALVKGREVIKSLEANERKPSEFTPSQILWGHISRGIRFNNRKLLVIESPNKSDVIRTALSLKMDTQVIATDGHFRELASEKGMPISNLIRPQWKEKSKYKQLAKYITDIGPDLEQVCIATDADQEGELIAWHFVELCNQVLGRDVAPTFYTRMRFLNLSIEEIKRAHHSATSGLHVGMIKSALTRTLLDSIISELYPVTLGLSDIPQRSAGVGRVQCGILDLIANTSIPQDKHFIAKGRINHDHLNFRLSHILPNNVSEIEAYVECDIPIERVPTSNTPSFNSLRHQLRLSKKKEVQTSEQESRQNQLRTLESELKKKLSVFLSLPLLCNIKVERQQVQLSGIPGMNTSRLLAAAWRNLGTSPNETMRLLKILYEDLPSPETTTLYLETTRTSNSAHGIIEPLDMGFTPEKLVKSLSSSKEYVLLGKLYQLIYDAALCTMAEGPFINLCEVKAQWRLDTDAMRQDNIPKYLNDSQVEVAFSIYDIHEPGWETLLPDELPFHISKSTGVERSSINGNTTGASLLIELFGDVDSSEQTYRHSDEVDPHHLINQLRHMLTTVSITETSDNSSLFIDDLLELMEQSSVGRPSTYAGSIAKVLDAKLVDIQNGRVTLTDEGKSRHEKIQSLPESKQLNAQYSDYLELILLDIEDRPDTAGQRLIQLCEKLISDDYRPDGLAKWLDTLQIDAEQKINRSVPIVYSSFAESDITLITAGKSYQQALNTLKDFRRHIEKHLSLNLESFSTMSPRLRAASRLAALNVIHLAVNKQDVSRNLLWLIRNSISLRWLVDLDMSETPISQEEYEPINQLIDIDALLGDQSILSYYRAVSASPFFVFSTEGQQ
jgi:DNA topoisomerase IA